MANIKLVLTGGNESLNSDPTVQKWLDECAAKIESEVEEYIMSRLVGAPIDFVINSRPKP